MNNLAKLCENIIDNNIVNINGTSGFIAGSSIYANFWSRDFLYPSPFLMSKPKWRKACSDHIFLILDNMRKTDFMMPKELDTMNPDWRVARGTFRVFFGMNPEKLPMKGILRPHFTDAVLSNAIDTNLLTIIAAMELYKYPEYKDKVYKRKQQLLDGLKYYKKYIRDGLIYQLPFSDFQDSSARVGFTFLTNLMFWKVVTELEKANFTNTGYADKLKELITKTFWIPELGIYRGIKDKIYMNIEANLLAIDWDFNNQQVEFWENIKNYKQWWKKPCYPGPPTVPKQPTCEKSICVRIAKIHGYHDEYLWSWIMGLAAKVAYKMNDKIFGNKILKLVEINAIRDNTIYDAYEYKNELIYQVKTYGFKAEYDWTWGAAFILEACQLSQQ